MRRHRSWLLSCALVWTALSACDCNETPPGQGTLDGGGAGGEGGTTTGDGQVSSVDGSSAPDRPGWVVDDSGSITVLEDGGVVITEDGGNQWLCLPMDCLGNGPQQCADCVDNDGDGIVDWRDPECLGPCDNTEGPGLDNGVGGTSGNSCGVDCYFDYGNGAGWDNCDWDHRCDELSPEAICAYDPSFVAAHGDRECPAVQSDTCSRTCKPITPNGCDCFGCCTFPVLAGQGPAGGDGYVWIGNLDGDNNSTCTLDALTDTSACPPCTPVPNCLNECGRCEICVGKPTPPEDCWRVDAGTPTGDAGSSAVDSGGSTLHDAATSGSDASGPRPDAATTQPDAASSGQCPSGLQPCGLPGQGPCQTGLYCLTGCCTPIQG